MKVSQVAAAALFLAFVWGGVGYPSRGLAETSVAEGSIPAVEQAAIDRLMQTMQIEQVVDVLRAEGLDYGASIADELFAGSGGADWQATVADIYATDRMMTAFSKRLSEELAGKPDVVAEVGAFFASSLGQRVLKLEIEARRSLLDQDTEAAAELAWSDLEAEGGTRVALLRRFVEANDLVDSNVMGALNANLAFYQGLSEAGPLGEDMPEGQILSDVWAQEPDIRQQTEDWLYPYLALGYSDLTDDELERYVEFSMSDAGQTLNAALFAAFDSVFVPISRALGVAAARQMAGQDI